MIIPSIDISKGRAIQLIGGKAFALDGGDPMEKAREFSRVGEIAVVDLDAALGQGNNSELVERLCRDYPCRVGGGIRDYGKAARLLDCGARSIVVGTMAEPEFLSALPRERLVAALDTRNGDIVVDGWRTATGRTIEDRVGELAPYVSGFLVTFVEREGREQGTDMARARMLRAIVDRADPSMRLVIAGGIRSGEEIAGLDKNRMDAQLGMALYKGSITMAQAFCAPLTSDRADSLIPTVVQDERGTVLGLVYSDSKSIEASLRSGRAYYKSRTRGLWEKGSSSGNGQVLVRYEADCDRDALLATVRQEGSGFCHRGTLSCFTAPGETFACDGMARLSRTLEARRAKKESGSYTQRLFDDPCLIAAKLREEAEELASADNAAEAVREAADLVYFASVKLETFGESFASVERELDARSYKITRRPGNAKREFLQAREETCQTGIH